MEEDDRDLLEVLIFDEIEETVGAWLRAIIQHLEEQAVSRRAHCKQPTPSGETAKGNASVPEAASENVSECVGPAAASTSDFGPIRFWQTRVKAALHSP
jgi:hypothetical protein